MRNLLEKDIDLYKELIDQANVVIGAFDKTGNIFIWNRAAEDLTGYDRVDVLYHKKVFDKLYPDPHHRSDFLKRVGVSSPGSVKNFESTLLTKLGDKKIISWSAISIKNKEGDIVGSFAVGIDVTLKHVMKQKERESFRALLKSVRIHEEDKRRYEEIVQLLKQEVNSLCRELSQPPRY